VAPYPAYCSKFKPSERRFFPHVTRACAGVLFDTLETVVNLMRQTRTKTGLTVTVHGIKRSYETGRKVAQAVKDTMKIVFDNLLPQWNYRAVPQLYLRQ
jgi:Rhodopirellula transposase DDE domain